MAITKAFTVLL